ncbi:hypothetical protein BJ138DRAFT_1118284 [Hygrophoropsis aurantiaca]|uniref:Uncharacterized protein n=1 Tax=Hygrophoropsis aurantiaca TaxID=72124 RepID=A0ACB7ZWY3_9AGAM|nr:hypothetical protein BJ138DRAFT_1118284 [Hygrophoropsis aurantiaca]
MPGPCFIPPPTTPPTTTMFLSFGLNKVVKIFRGHRGAVASINSLPVETLSEIFLFTVLGDPSTDRCAKTLKSCTWVCRRWRQVALDDSRLWGLAINPEDSRDWMKEMLLRSKNTPFRIDFYHRSLELELPSPRCEVTTQNVLLAMQSMHRVSHFRIAAPSRLCLQLLSKLTQSLPTLSLIHVTNSDQRHFFRDDPAPHLPAGFFMLDAPELDAFSITDWNFNWDLFKFASLTQLHVVFSDTHRASRPTFQQLSLVLAKLPLLTAVSLMNILPANVPVVTSPRISLQYLERLGLEGRVQECTDFLNILEHPAYTAIHLICHDTPFPFSAHTPIVSIIRDRFSDHQPRAVSLDFGPYYFYLQASSDESDEVGTVQEAIRLEFQWDLFPETQTPDSVDFLPLALVLPSGDVDVLCITGHSGLTISTSMWNVLLSQFKEIEALELCGVPLLGLLPLLLAATHGFLPRLKTINALLASSDDQAIINRFINDRRKAIVKRFIEERRDSDYEEGEEGGGAMMEPWW